MDAGDVNFRMIWTLLSGGPLVNGLSSGNSEVPLESEFTPTLQFIVIMQSVLQHLIDMLVTSQIDDS